MSVTRILIVEDESVVSKDVQKRLTALGYAAAGTAVSGESAIEKVQETRPDLVLMDIMLKGEMDGVQAAQHIRDNFDVPVIYLTAHSDDATLQRAKITEPFGYIIKPFEERDLHTTIEMGLYKHKAEKELKWQASINAAMAELAKALISPMALDEISYLVLEKARQLTASQFGFVGYIDPRTGHMVSSTITRDVWEACNVPDKDFIFKKFGGLGGWVLNERQPLLTNDPAREPRSTGAPQGHIPIERFLGVPALLNASLVGMVALANASRPYTERDLAVVERLANLFALAIQRARMEEELREWNRTLEQRVIERTAQLRQSEARVRHLYENSPVMMHTVDEHGRICDVNFKWLEETGYTRAEALGRNTNFLMTSESAERAYCEIQPQLESAGRVRDVPYQFIQKSGTVIEVLLDCLVTTDPAGQRIGLTVVRNVTAQREAERRVRLQSAALEAAANAIVITNRFGRVSWANSAFARLTGYAVDEIVGQTMRLLKSNQQDAAFYKNLWDTIQAGQVWRGELVNRRKDGSLYVEEQTITPVRDERGDIVYFVGIKQDITERKRIEEALRASEQRFRSLVESADDIIAMQDPADGRYLFIHVPPRYGIAEAELVGRQPGQIIAPEMAQQFVEMVRRVAREGQAQMIERDITLGGRRIYLQTTFSPIVDEQGRVAAVLSISRDITIQRQMQVKMMHADRLSAVGKLAASVAHEINNPLQSVIGCLGLAQEALDEQSEDPREYLRVAREEVLRIKRIVARMRDLYRPESGEKKPTDVNALVEQVLDVSRKRCQESGVEVEWAPAADMPRLTVAPDQIKQVFLNLLLNAIDAMPGGGKLRVATTYQTVEPAGVVIRFSDSGVGIPSDIKPHIFETFYSTKPEGSGLGLSISYNIIEQHGGRLDVDSREGEGSTFSVWLPV